MISVSDIIISVVIPAYCAEKHLEKVVRGIPRYVNFIIIVDDDSNDETEEIANRLKSLDTRGKVISHENNHGVGGAMISGYNLAQQLESTVIVKMDADDQMDPAYLLPLISPIIKGKADYTKGNRFLVSTHSMPVLRRVGNLGLSLMTKAASGYWDIFDPTNGYTAIHGSIIPLLNKAMLDNRFFYETSMLMQLYLIRAVVKDVLIPPRYADEISHLSEWKTLYEFPLRLFKGLLSRLWIQYFVRDFGIFSVFLLSGMILFTFGMVFGIYHWWISASIFHAATPTGTIMVAILPVILGVQLLLQAIVLDVQNVPVLPLQSEQYPRTTGKYSNRIR
jgi:dolichol-phosphate mannosyltransferase